MAVLAYNLMRTFPRKMAATGHAGTNYTQSPGDRSNRIESTEETSAIMMFHKDSLTLTDG